MAFCSHRSTWVQGYLHDGHVSLVLAARYDLCDLKAHSFRVLYF